MNISLLLAGLVAQCLLLMAGLMFALAYIDGGKERMIEWNQKRKAKRAVDKLVKELNLTFKGE